MWSESEKQPTRSENMLSFVPQTPIFSGNWDHHRPSVSSPLSSSPLRATSPLSPIDKNALPRRQVQSSPIKPVQFKYASRSARSNPVVRNREQKQEDRRRSFFQSVRNKSDERAWARRDIEGQTVRNTWLAHLGQLVADAPPLSEADIEDAIAFSQRQDNAGPVDQEADMMLDSVPEEQEAELDAMVAEYEALQRQKQTQQAPETDMSDEDYDDVFAELLSQEHGPSQQDEDDHVYMDHEMS